MRPIQDTLELNNLWYEVWKRNNNVALYGIGGAPDIEAVRFEVFKILTASYGAGLVECLPSDLQLKEGMVDCFNDYESANEYFDKLTKETRRDSSPKAG